MVSKEKGLYVSLVVLLVAVSTLSGYIYASSQSRAAAVYNPVLQGTQTSPKAQNTTLHVSGLGQLSVNADLAQVTLGVTTQAPNASDAIGQNAQKMANVFNALKNLGIADADLKTESFSLSLVYSTKASVYPEQIVGYQVNNVLVASVHDLKTIGKVIDTATGAGANQVQGVSFMLSDAEFSKDKVISLQMAAQDAKNKAQTLVASLGMKIVGVLEIDEGSFVYQPIQMSLASAGASPSVQTQINPGDITVSDTVQVTYIIQ